MQNLQDKSAMKKSSIHDQQTFDLLTSLMPVGVLTTDENGILSFYNETAEELWGRSPRLNDRSEKRFCGALKLYRIDGTPMPHDESPVAETLRSRTGMRQQEVIMENPDGKKINVLVNVDPIIDDHGNLKGAINVFQDIT